MNIINITAENKRPKEMIRLAAYCRVSSSSADQLHSFATQIRYYKDYEKKHPQYKLVDIYADEGLTGTSLEKRDEQKRLIRDCKKGKIDCVIVKRERPFPNFKNKLYYITIRAAPNGVTITGCLAHELSAATRRLKFFGYCSCPLRWWE